MNICYKLQLRLLQQQELTQSRDKSYPNTAQAKANCDRRVANLKNIFKRFKSREHNQPHATRSLQKRGVFTNIANFLTGNWTWIAGLAVGIGGILGIMTAGPPQTTIQSEDIDIKQFEGKLNNKIQTMVHELKSNLVNLSMDMKGAFLSTKTSLLLVEQTSILHLVADQWNTGRITDLFFDTLGIEWPKERPPTLCRLH